MSATSSPAPHAQTDAAQDLARPAAQAERRDLEDGVVHVRWSSLTPSPPSSAARAGAPAATSGSDSVR